MDNPTCSDCGKPLTFEETLMLGFMCEQCAVKATNETLKEEVMTNHEQT